MAISCSPITTRVVPWRFECSLSPQRQADGARLLHDLATLKGVGNGNKQAARLAEICPGDNLRVRGIAGERLDASPLSGGAGLGASTLAKATSAMLRACAASRSSMFSIIALAISCSPMTTRVAPCFMR